MNRQKVIEIRVCDKCGREVSEKDFSICPSCQRDICWMCRTQHNEPVPDSDWLIMTTYWCPEHEPQRKKGKK